jgi:hypothetical protein
MSNDPYFSYMNCARMGTRSFPGSTHSQSTTILPQDAESAEVFISNKETLPTTAPPKSYYDSQVCEACAREFQGEFCITLLLTKGELLDLYRLILDEHTTHLTEFMAANLIRRGDQVCGHMS